MVAEHQLQLHAFTPLHLLFQLLLGKVDAHQWDFSSVFGTDVIKEVTFEATEEPPDLQQGWEMDQPEIVMGQFLDFTLKKTK